MGHHFVSDEKSEKYYNNTKEYSHKAWNPILCRKSLGWFFYRDLARG